MKGSEPSIFRYFTKNVLFIFIGFQFVLFAVLSVFIRTWIRPDAEVSIAFDIIYSGLAVTGLAIFSFICRKIFKMQPRGKSKLAALLPYMISSLLQLLFILFMPAPVEGGDAWQVRTIAMQISQGNFQAFEPMHYLSQYPNNTGLALFYSFFFLFMPKSFYVIKVLNLIFNLGTMYMIVKLYELVFPEKSKHKRAFQYYLLFFVPPALFVNYTYGDVPSAFLTTSAVFFALRYTRSGAFRHCAAAAALLLAAYFLRQSALLAGGAIALYWIYTFFLKNKVLRVRTSAAIAAMAVLIAFQFTVVDAIFRQFGCWDTPLEENAQPITRWINIGIPHDLSYGYWDQGEVTHKYMDLKGDKEALNQQLLSDIGASLTSAPPQNIAAGYLVKNYWTWSEGTFESIKYGACATPRGEWRYSTGSAPMNIVLTFLDFANTCIKAHYIFVLFFAGAWFLIKRRDETGDRLLFGLLILCFYCFYTVWEMKSRYLYLLYPVLLLASFDAATRVYGRIRRGLKKRRHEASAKT